MTDTAYISLPPYQTFLFPIIPPPTQPMNVLHSPIFRGALALVAAALLILPTQFAAAQGIQFNEGKWTEAVAQAKREGKMLFVDAFTSWCGPCKMLVAQTFPQPAVGEFFNANFINVSLDMEKGEGVAFANKYGVTMYPTMLIIDKDGKPVDRLLGFNQAPALLDFGRRALGKSENLPELTTKYENGDHSPATLRAYVLALRHSGMTAVKPANEYLTLPTTAPTLTTREGLTFIFEAVERADSRLFDLLIQNRALLEQQYTKPVFEQKVNTVCTETARVAGEFKSRELLEEAKTKCKKHGTKATEFGIKADMDFARVTNNTADYVAAAKRYAAKVINNNPAELSRLAAAFGTNPKLNPTDLRPAIEWAAKAAKREEKYDYWITYADLLLKIGDRTKAHAIAEKAVAIAQKTKVSAMAAQLILDRTNEK